MTMMLEPSRQADVKSVYLVTTASDTDVVEGIEKSEHISYDFWQAIRPKVRTV